MNARTRVAFPATVLAAAALAGCAASLHPTAREAAVEQSVTERLTELVGQRPDGVDCPGDLDGVVGATMVCLLTDSGRSYPVTLRVTGVEGDQVTFDFQVAERPLP